MFFKVQFILSTINIQDILTFKPFLSNILIKYPLEFFEKNKIRTLGTSARKGLTLKKVEKFEIVAKRFNANKYSLNNGKKIQFYPQSTEKRRYTIDVATLENQ